MDIIEACEVLQISLLSDNDTIRKAYKKLAGKYHPDRNKAADATVKMQTINAAWDLLSSTNMSDRQAVFEAEELRRTRAHPRQANHSSSGDAYRGGATGTRPSHQYAGSDTHAYQNRPREGKTSSRVTADSVTLRKIRRIWWALPPIIRHLFSIHADYGSQFWTQGRVQRLHLMLLIEGVGAGLMGYAYFTRYIDANISLWWFAVAALIGTIVPSFLMARKQMWLFFSMYFSLGWSVFSWDMFRGLDAPMTISVALAVLIWFAFMRAHNAIRFYSGFV